MGGTAIIAGGGPLPALLADHLEAAGQPFLIAALEGAGAAGRHGREILHFPLERLALLFDRLHGEGIARVTLAGAVRRPALDPERFDPRTAALLPELLPALSAGDDAALRAVIALFEAEGFEVAGAADLRPDLLAGPGHLAGPPPGEADLADAERAAAIVAALGAVDVGQGAVVAQGQCLAVEAAPGTDAMLAWVAEVAGAARPDPAGARGVLFKAPKPGQERRADLPAIGPETVRGAALAGLAGIAVEAGGVLLLDRAAIVAEAEAAGLSLWARAP